MAFEYTTGCRVRFIHTHRDTGIITRQAQDGMVGGDWFVKWDHDPDKLERPVWAENLEPLDDESAIRNRYGDYCEWIKDYQPPMSFDDWMRALLRQQAAR